ncbi:MAG TPA: YciI family protein [Mucilaginibacter sp.]
MEQFIAILREPDGRADEHPEQDMKEHREKWNNWFAKYAKAGNLLGGNALTLNGKMVRGYDAKVIDDIHKVGTEIVGGYLLLQAANLNEAVAIVQELPIYEFDGYAEVREFKIYK